VAFLVSPQQLQTWVNFLTSYLMGDNFNCT
jgi:hypothetical protein